MAVPRNRLSNARTNKRRAHHAIKEKFLSQCSNCSAKQMPHRICQECGYYAGRAVLKKETTQE